MGFGKFLGKVAPFGVGNLFGGGILGAANKALFPKYNDPGQAAAPYFNQIPGIAHQQYDPYIQQGQQAWGSLQPGYEQQATNPKDYINDIYDSYEPSKGYQFKKDQLMKALGATAASGGYAGSQYDQEQRGELLNGLLSSDMQQWLQNVMGAQQSGRQGLEGAVGRGYESNDNLTDILTNALAQQGGLAAGGVIGNNNRREQRAGNLFGLAGAGLGAWGARGKNNG